MTPPRSFFRPLLFASALLGLGLCPLLAGEGATQASSSLREQVSRAIRELRVVTFVYQGHARTVEPHACGVARSGEAVLHGYQTAGGSASGAVPGWRTYALDKLEALTVTDTRFAGPRADFASDRPRLDPAWAEAAPAAPATMSAP